MTGLNINKLEGAVKAFADAADQNNDGFIDQTEVKLFNQFINGAQLNQDKGLKVERERVGDAMTPDDPKKARKMENKTYKDLFGKSEVADVKSAENEANRRVIREFNKLKGAVSPEILNKAIAARPDMADYNGDAEGYKKALESWAFNVENALAESIMQHTDSVGGAIMAQNAVNTAVILDGEAALAEQADKNAEKLENTIHQEGADTRTKVGEEGAKTRRAVHSEGAATRSAVREEGRNIRNTVREEGVRTRNVIHDESAHTRDVVRQEAVETRNTVREEGANVRNTVRETAKETQEIEAAADNVLARLDEGGAVHTEKTRNEVIRLKDDIVRSNLPHERKLKLLDELAKLSAHNVIDSDKLIAKKEQLEREKDHSFKSSETPVVEEKPVREPVGHEEPFYEKGDGSVSTGNVDKKEKPRPTDEGKKSENSKEQKSGPGEPEPSKPEKTLKEWVKELGEKGRKKDDFNRLPKNKFN